MGLTMPQRSNRLISALPWALPAPMLALQILWVNLVTDTTNAIPLGLEPKYGDELKQPPRHPKVGLLFPGLLFRILFLSGMMSVGVFIVFNWAQGRVSL